LYVYGENDESPDSINISADFVQLMLLKLYGPEQKGKEGKDLPISLSRFLAGVE